MNGAYFGPFRQALARDFSFRRVHVYDARDDAFSGDGVLQENVIPVDCQANRRRAAS